MAMSLGHLNSNFLTIEVGDLTIPWVQEIKLLGLYIDTMLYWNHHYNLLYNKILLNKKLLTFSQNKLMVQAKLVLYYAHIHSHLNYAILVWGSMLSKNKLDKLFKVQRECMRSILNVDKTAHADPIFKRLKILKLTQMIDLELYNLGFKIYKKQLPAPILSLFNSIGTCQSGKKGINITHIKKIFLTYYPILVLGLTIVLCVKQ